MAFLPDPTSAASICLFPPLRCRRPRISLIPSSPTFCFVFPDFSPNLMARAPNSSFPSAQMGSASTGQRDDLARSPTCSHTFCQPPPPAQDYTTFSPWIQSCERRFCLYYSAKASPAFRGLTFFSSRFTPPVIPRPFTVPQERGFPPFSRSRGTVRATCFGFLPFSFSLVVVRGYVELTSPSATLSIEL